MIDDISAQLRFGPRLDHFFRREGEFEEGYVFEDIVDFLDEIIESKFLERLPDDDRLRAANSFSLVLGSMVATDPVEATIRPAIDRATNLFLQLCRDCDDNDYACPLFWEPFVQAALERHNPETRSYLISKLQSLSPRVRSRAASDALKAAIEIVQGD